VATLTVSASSRRSTVGKPIEKLMVKEHQPCVEAMLAELKTQCVHGRTVFPMASNAARTRKEGSKSYIVRWRDPKTRASQGLTVTTLTEAETLQRLLDAIGQSFQVASSGR